MPKLTISLAQMQVTPGDITRNTNQMQRMVAEAARRKSNLLVFPELFTTGYVLDEAKERADNLNKGMFAEISNLATKGNLAITGSVLEKRGLEVANSMPFFAPNGRMLGVYRKMHLFKLFDEDKYLAPGQGYFVKVNANGNITLNENMQSHQNGNHFLRSSSDRFEIKLKINKLNKDTVLKRAVSYVL